MTKIRQVAAAGTTPKIDGIIKRREQRFHVSHTSSQNYHVILLSFFAHFDQFFVFAAISIQEFVYLQLTQSLKRLCVF